MSDSVIAKILDWIVDVGINGLGFLASAQNVAEHHRKSCKTTEKAIDSVIAWRTAYAGGTGFVTAGLLPLWSESVPPHLNMPINLPSRVYD